ncbi:MAG: hypothetical protein KJ709_03850 [Nanoarchaeota archaeon]|nr:hypothetical protein [Nanoarchaeota archaeon]
MAEQIEYLADGVYFHDFCVLVNDPNLFHRYDDIWRVRRQFPKMPLKDTVAPGFLTEGVIERAYLESVAEDGIFSVEYTFPNWLYRGETLTIPPSEDGSCWRGHVERDGKEVEVITAKVTPGGTLTIDDEVREAMLSHEETNKCVETDKGILLRKRLDQYDLGNFYRLIQGWQDVVHPTFVAGFLTEPLGYELMSNHGYSLVENPAMFKEKRFTIDMEALRETYERLNDGVKVTYLISPKESSARKTECEVMMTSDEGRPIAKGEVVVMPFKRAMQLLEIAERRARR